MIRALLLVMPLLPPAYQLELYRIAEREMCHFHPQRIDVCLAIAELEARCA